MVFQEEGYITCKIHFARVVRAADKGQFLFFHTSSNSCFSKSPSCDVRRSSQFAMFKCVGKNRAYSRVVSGFCDSHRGSEKVATRQESSDISSQQQRDITRAGSVALHAFEKERWAQVRVNIGCTPVRYNCK